MDSARITSGSKGWPRWWRRFQIGARRANFFVIMEIVSVLAFLAMSTVTFMAVTARSLRSELLPTNLTATLLVGTLVPALAILVLLGRRLALQRSTALAGGGGMHVRLVALFSLVSAVPTLLVVIFASFLFQSGVEFWFSDNSRGLLENANKLARGYYEQVQRDMEYESLAMAGDLREVLSQNTMTSRYFIEVFAAEVHRRKLDQSIILTKGSDGILRRPAVASGPNPVSENISIDVIRQLDGGASIVVSSQSNSIQAVTPIDRRSGVYLFTERRSDLLSQGYAQNIVRAYDQLSKRARIQQLRFNIALFVASLALVGLSVWFALRIADRQVQPLYDLVGAARQVGSGNFSMRVEGRTGADEIGLLNRAFNRMTQQLERQTTDLRGANQQLDERRAFIEAVLESVTAGVISTDSTGKILLINGSAQKLLQEKDAVSPVGEELIIFAPQLASLADSGKNGGIVQYSKGNELLTLAVKSTREASGYVITFEDITRQLLDQRQAAWSDVAQRIAHEIKNPLTPIQLATERLSRRYRKLITADAELFEELTGTIIRQVGDLRRMVDEFSSFARLPKPIFRNEDAVDLARQALFLQEVARPDINFTFVSKGKVGSIACDRHQFGQAMTNVLKNAIEAVEARCKAADADYRGRVKVAIEAREDEVLVSISDNGIGLPQDRERIVEPYVTTREKGTGLGLAIVKKIVEEHGGEMTFSSIDTGGTVVTMRFARDPRASPPAPAIELPTRGT